MLKNIPTKVPKPELCLSFFHLDYGHWAFSELRWSKHFDTAPPPEFALVLWHCCCSNGSWSCSACGPLSWWPVLQPKWTGGFRWEACLRMGWIFRCLPACLRVLFVCLLSLINLILMKNNCNVLYSAHHTFWKRALGKMVVDRQLWLHCRISKGVLSFHISIPRPAGSD